MRRNEAHKLTFEDPIDEKPMESRIARLESDVSHINSTLAIVQVDIRELRNGLDATNEALAEVKNTVTALDGKVTTFRAELRGDLAAMETKLIKWIIGTMIASMGTAIACAGLVLAIGKVIFGTKVP